MGDNDLVIKCKEGNSLAFGKLYDSYFEKIYRYIYYKTGHKEVAEDLTSQTFFKAFEKIKQFNEKKGNFSSWIYRIAHNNIVDHYRKEKSHFDIDDAWGLADSFDFLENIDDKRTLEKIRLALDKLSSVQKEVVLLRVWEGLSYKEISEILGKSENACKMNFSRAMKEIRSKDFLLFVLFLFGEFFKGLMKIL